MKFLSQTDFSQIPVKGLVPESGATPPPNPTPGQLWVDTSTNPRVVKFWDGTKWVRVDGSDLPDGSITDAKISASAAISISKLAVNPLNRANHTGTQPASTISDLTDVIEGTALNRFAPPTGSVTMAGQRLTNLGTPVSDTDAANKRYVDDARAGIAVKDPVRIVVTSSISINAPGATLDGVNLSPGDRILLAGQNDARENGIYVWQGATTPLIRAPDADAIGEIVDGTLVAVAEGTNEGTQWIQTATPSGAPGNWNQVWTKFSTGGQTYTAGNGLQLDGATFSVKAADSSISVSSSGVSVGLVPVSKGGTGATTAAGARANLETVGVYTALLPALSAGVWTQVTHNLNTSNPLEPTFQIVSTGEIVKLDSRVVSASTIEVMAHVDVAANTIRVTVVG